MKIKLLFALRFCCAPVRWESQVANADDRDKICKETQRLRLVKFEKYIQYAAFLLPYDVRSYSYVKPVLTETDEYSTKNIKFAEQFLFVFRCVFRKD